MIEADISRRHFLSQLLGASLLIAGCKRKAPLELDMGLIKSFGLQPGRIGFRHIYAAGPPAEMLLYALVPQWMLGWSNKKSAEALKFLPPHAKTLPFLGSINGRGTSVSFETLLRKNVDLIVDMGLRTPTYVSTAARISAQLNVPYILIDGRLALAAEQIKQLGQLVYSPYIEQLTSLAQRSIAFAAMVAAETDHNLNVYYARGADGLETSLKDSIHAEVITLLGAKNSADELGTGGLGKITLEQVLKWQPDIILTQNKDFMYMVYNHPIWRHVKAVAKKAVYLMPSLPAGWIDGPPGINRLLGIYALAPIFQQLPRNYYLDEIQALYQALYHTTLTLEQLKYLGLEA